MHTAVDGSRPSAPYQHQAEQFTSEEMLLAYLAERLDRMVDHMIGRGSSRLAVFGSRKHAFWLQENITGMQSLPLTAFIDRPDETEPAMEIGIPMLQIDDPALPEHADTILIADDACEHALHELALRHVQPGITLFRLYHRLPIGRDALGPNRLQRAAPNAVVEAKPGTVLAGSVRASAQDRLDRLAVAV
ncbi:MAG: hypothetical protein ACIAQF_03610 [Phycisphaerales bacterium JB065]